MNYEFVSHSVEETQAFAEKVGRDSKPGTIVALSGELGAGKTTFVQGFAKGLGVEQRIISPTFIIVRKYRIKNYPFDKLRTLSISKSELRIMNFYHVDLYRIQSETDLEGLGFQEILDDTEGVVVIEWPERMGLLLPRKRVEIRIESLGENERKIFYG